MWPGGNECWLPAHEGVRAAPLKRRDSVHPFRIGDLVECIDDTPLPARGVKSLLIRRGSIYRISETLSDSEGQYGVGLMGCESYGVRYYAWRFRALRAADPQFTAALRELKEPSFRFQHQLAAAMRRRDNLVLRDPGYRPHITVVSVTMRYAARFGKPPKWVLSCQERRRIEILRMAFVEDRPLPQSRPATNIAPRWLRGYRPLFEDAD